MNRKRLHKELVKIASSATSTTPLYITKSPSGKDVVFTATDLVKGEGKLRDGSTSFKPKKWKAHSMANMVRKQNLDNVRGYKKDNKKNKKKKK